jgi:hypothetical protein
VTKVAVHPRALDIAAPAGFPRTKVDAAVRRAGQLADQIKAVGEEIASVEISADGAVKVLTVAGASIR